MKVGFFGLLTLMFIYLKLTGQVDWGWWAVWSPMIFVWATGALAIYLKDKEEG